MSYPSSPGDGMPSRRPRLLLVEDDNALSRLLSQLLRDEGYAVVRAEDGQRALHRGLVSSFDVVVLDRSLPARDGLEVLAAWRARGVTTPTLVLSARGTATDRVEGLDAGAEDYLAKPFDVGELLARLRALRRRHSESASVLTVGRWFLDVPSQMARSERTAEDDGSGVLLSERETRLLEVLARNPQRIYPRGELLALVFATADTTNTVDTYVSYCRRKLDPEVIRTVRGVGYQAGRP
ncbi:MAG: response regulator transcription factor [Mycobacteriales bacterium]